MIDSEMLHRLPGAGCAASKRTFFSEIPVSPVPDGLGHPTVYTFIQNSDPVLCTDLMYHFIHCTPRSSYCDFGSIYYFL